MTSNTEFEQLITKVQGLSVEAEFLPFEPGEHHGHLKQCLDDVPRYLFRVHTPLSDGTTNTLWAKSKDASQDIPRSVVDIFAQNKIEVARMLNRHLRWWGKPSDPDNLVSWTSSLLFALQYIFYRHYSSKDRSSLENIHLCVVDTTEFRRGVFARDLDLIDTFRAFDRDLERFQELRTVKQYYFGEYLSQGALRIQDKCSTVPAQAIIDKGLFNIRYEFSYTLPAQGTKLAKKVNTMREVFHNLDSPNITAFQTRAALDIAELFGGIWRLPMAANLMALVPTRDNGIVVLHAFNGAKFSVNDKENCSPAITKVKACNTLPEVEQFATILNILHEDFFLKKLRSCLRGVTRHLLEAHTMCRDTELNPGPFSAAVREDHEAVLLELSMIEAWSRQISSKVGTS